MEHIRKKRFICQNIQDGIQFQMAFYSEDEIEVKNNIKISTISGSQVEWVEEVSLFF